MRELEPIIRNARWRMLGHTLRMNDTIPAKRATLHYFDQIEKGFLGRPRHTLPLEIDNDLKRASKQEPNHPVLTLGLPNQLRSIEDLRTLEALAAVRPKWEAIVKCITDTQVPEPPEPIQRCLRPRRDAKRQ
jgi:hypothetical protein